MTVWWLALALSVGFSGAAGAQERFSLFVPSPPENVERMIRMAELRDGDVVLDLGSGDGRVVIAAALAHPSVRGRGVDIDKELVRGSNNAARAEGVADRVQFLHQDVFDADLSDVSVIFMWLWPELQRLLRPKILAQARPGTRVITVVWDMGSWQPMKVDRNGAAINKWVVPARVHGYWDWTFSLDGNPTAYSAIFEQQFQNVEGTVRAGDRRGIVDRVKVYGEDISFALNMTIDRVGFLRHEFSGKVKGDIIEGSMRILNRQEETVSVLPWQAKRAVVSGYLSPQRGATR